MFVENDRQVALILRAPVLSVLFLICWFVPAPAQQPATVTFTLDFPNSEPDHYVISVASDGHASYESNGKLSAEAQDDAYRLDFSLSPASRARLFDLARRPHYFRGGVDSLKRKLVSPGSKAPA